MWAKTFYWSKFLLIFPAALAAMLTLSAYLRPAGSWITMTPAVWVKWFSHQLKTRFVGSRLFTFRISLLLFILKVGYKQKYKNICEQSKNCRNPKVLFNRPKPEVASARKWRNFLSLFAASGNFLSWHSCVTWKTVCGAQRPTDRPRLVTSWPASKHDTWRLGLGVRPSLFFCQTTFRTIFSAETGGGIQGHVSVFRFYFYEVFLCVCVCLPPLFPWFFQGPLTWHLTINIDAVVLDASILSMRVSTSRDIYMTAYFTSPAISYWLNRLTLLAGI